MQELKPSHRYLNKLYLIYSLVAGLILIFAFTIGGLIGLEDPKGGFVFGSIFGGLGGLFWIIAMLLSGPYFRSLRYEIHDDEVIVHVGIWTRSIKHVPFRTVTNIKTNRDIFDRWFFGLGSLNIQTAGMSGKTGAEEALVGLPNVQEVYETVGARLRKYRGAMTPTGGVESDDAADGSFAELLEEVRAIRAAVEK